jgi:hypothetical protein
VNIGRIAGHGLRKRSAMHHPCALLQVFGKLLRVIMSLWGTLTIGPTSDAALFTPGESPLARWQWQRSRSPHRESPCRVAGDHSRTGWIARTEIAMRNP